MKVLIFADIHFNKDDDDPRRLYDKFNIVKFIRDWCISNKIDIGIFGGDWWTNRKQLDIEVINVGYAAAELLAQSITVYAIAGNHDFYYKNLTDVHSLAPFKHIDNFNIILSPSSINIGSASFTMIPYLPSQQFIETINSINSDIVIAHQTFNGFKANNGFILENDLNTDVVAKFKRVISGDIHKHQEIKNITYVGAPLPQDFNDLGDDFGFMVLDTDTLEMDRIIIPSRRYHNITASNIDYDIIKDNFINVIFDGETVTEVQNELLSVKLDDVIAEYVKINKFNNMDNKLTLQTLSDVMNFVE